jgi:CheY-like chemotaxis protein
MAGGIKTILVVDDDGDLRELLRLLLESAGYAVETARDGREALQRVTAHPPAVVLLDMKMPVMNGWQFAEALRRDFNHRVPIVVVTAAEDARKSAQEVDAEGFLGKPFDLDDVLAAVARYSADSTARP